MTLAGAGGALAAERAAASPVGERERIEPEPARQVGRAEGGGPSDDRPSAVPDLEVAGAHPPLELGEGAVLELERRVLDHPGQGRRLGVEPLLELAPQRVGERGIQDDREDGEHRQQDREHRGAEADAQRDHDATPSE